MKHGTERSSCSTAPSINVTPLIDVLLVLLIIFMVIQPQREGKLEVKAPQPATSETEPVNSSTLMLTVSGEFQLALNQTPLQIEELLPTLSNLMEQRSPDFRTLFIRAPRQLPYDVIANLVDLAKGSGVITIGLIAAEE